jgi:hypothetical protein
MKSGLAALGLGLLSVMGCERGDARLERLTVGMAKDSVTAAMGGAPKRLDPYLYKGQYIEALYYPKPGKTDSLSLTDRKMAPVVLIDGKLKGWGWVYWDSVAAANNIQVAAKE